MRWVPLGKVLRFAVYSAVGLALDVALFVFLVSLGVRAGYANALSSAMGVTFVFMTSTRYVFNGSHGSLLRRLLAYVSYHATAVVLASWEVDAIVLVGALPVVAKALVLPVTFACNYAFLDFLTRVSTMALNTESQSKGR
jgi:putative flippase GtrA